MGNLMKALEEKILLCDGAMGTQLQAAGLQPGECGDAWNLDRPGQVLEIQRAYVDAGSDCITTNTFGASRLNLERHGLADRVEEINCRGAQIAREAFGGKPGFVLGDLGPFGGLMEPYGTVSEEAAAASYREQAEALVAAGVDAIIIETQTVLEELEIAVRQSREAGARWVLASVSFDVTRDGTDVRTMMGATPEQAAERIQRAGAHVAGTNCGSGVDMQWAGRILERYRGSCDLPLMAQPNAGTPTLEGGSIIYRSQVTEMAAQIRRLIESGARIVGACCGSTPDHIRALRAELTRLGR